MNTNTVISLPVSADLSAYSDVAVKLTSTGIALANAGDRIIGTMLQGNDAPANGQSAVGMSASVFLSAANGIHFITVANNSAIVTGDELEAWPGGRFGGKGGVLTGTAQFTGDTITITNHGLTNGSTIAFTVLTTSGGGGLSTGVNYYVISATANTFQVSLTSGGSAVDITTADYSVATLRLSAAGATAGVAVDSCPASSAGGVIRAILFNGQPTTGFQVLKAAKTLTMADSGKTFLLDLAGGFTVTLPVTLTSAGAKFKFIVKTAPTTAYIITGSLGASEDTLIGYPVAALGSDETGNGNAAGDLLNFVASTALPGDWAIFECDGLNWYIQANCKATGAITITG